MVYGNKNWLDFEKPADKHAREQRETRAVVAHENEKRMGRKAKGVTHEQILEDGRVGREGARANEENRKGWITKAIQSHRHDDDSGGHARTRHRTPSHSS